MRGALVRLRLSDGPGARRAAAAGEVLMREGDVADAVLQLERGHVKVTTAIGRRPTAVLNYCGPGDLLGEIGAVTGTRSATVIALEPVEFWSTTAGDYRRRLGQDPGLALAVHRRLADRLLGAERRATSHLTGDVAARVARTLLDLAERFGVEDDDGVVIGLPISQEELAGLSGSSLESVVRSLRALRLAGCITTRRREVSVVDLAGLRARAQF